MRCEFEGEWDKPKGEVGDKKMRRLSISGVVARRSAKTFVRIESMGEN